MEKNRRVAKAYARAQVIAINGSDLDFDGYRIGLNGFHNPKRDFITEDVKKYIGSVCHTFHTLTLSLFPTFSFTLDYSSSFYSYLNSSSYLTNCQFDSNRFCGKLKTEWLYFILTLSTKNDTK